MKKNILIAALLIVNTGLIFFNFEQQTQFRFLESNYKECKEIILSQMDSIKKLNNELDKVEKMELMQYPD